MEYVRKKEKMIYFWTASVTVHKCPLWQGDESPKSKDEYMYRSTVYFFYLRHVDPNPAIVVAVKIFS